MKQVKNEIAKFIGLLVIGLIAIGASVLIVYAVIGALTDTGRHILATALAFAVPVAYALGLQVAKSHKAGLQQGIDLKLSARERSRQTARPVMPTASPAARFDGLLPTVGSAVIGPLRDDTDTPIDL